MDEPFFIFLLIFLNSSTVCFFLQSITKETMLPVRKKNEQKPGLEGKIVKE